MHVANLQVADRTRAPSLILKVSDRVGRSPRGEEGGRIGITRVVPPILSPPYFHNSYGLFNRPFW